jgi:hypothetical protein
MPMPQIIPTPRDGEKQTTDGGGRARPWPKGKRLVLPVLTAAFVLIPSGYAAACIDHDLHDKASMCEGKDHPTWSHDAGSPCAEPTVEPGDRSAPTTEPDPTTSVTAVPEDPTVCDGGDETCTVVSGDPGFTG